VLADIATVIAPIFICAGIGFLWGKLGKPFSTEMVTEIGLNIGIPCLIFSTLTRLNVSAAAFAETAGAYIAATALFLAIGAGVLRIAGLPLATFLPGQAFCNNGNMGLPLCLFAFGEPGLAFAISIFVISSLGSFTVGLGIYSGRASWRALIFNPIIIGVAISLVFMIARWQPPQFVANTVQILGGVAIPLMLVSLGVAIARLKVGGLRRAVALAVLRLVMGFSVGAGIATAIGLTGPAHGVLVLQAAMPIAVNNYLLAQRYGRAPEEVAGTVVISTALSFATLPLLLWLVL